MLGFEYDNKQRLLRGTQAVKVIFAKNKHIVFHSDVQDPSAVMEKGQNAVYTTSRIDHVKPGSIVVIKITRKETEGAWACGRIIHEGMGDEDR